MDCIKLAVLACALGKTRDDIGNEFGNGYTVYALPVSHIDEAVYEVCGANGERSGLVVFAFPENDNGYGFEKIFAKNDITGGEIEIDVEGQVLVLEKRAKGRVHNSLYLDANGISMPNFANVRWSHDKGVGFGSDVRTPPESRRQVNGGFGRSTVLAFFKATM